MTYVHMHVGMEEKKRTKTRIRMEGIRITHSCISPHVRNEGNIFPIPKPGNNFPVLPSVIAQFECACTQLSFAIETL